MVRELAGYDPDEARRILRWPLREALVAYLALLRRHAEAEFRHAELMFAIVSPWNGKAKPPKRPAILDDEEPAE